MGSNSKDFPFTRLPFLIAPTNSLANSTSDGPGNVWAYNFMGIKKILSRNINVCSLQERGFLLNY